MEYKYKGKTYRLSLNDDGKIECRAEEIVADTVAECQAAIRSTIEKEANAPRIPILTFGGGYRKNELKYYEGTTSGVNVGRYGVEFWVSWKDEKGKAQREKTKYFYRDTPENRAKLDEIIVVRRKIANLEKIERDLSENISYFSEESE